MRKVITQGKVTRLVTMVEVAQNLLLEVTKELKRVERQERSQRDDNARSSQSNPE